MLTSLALTGAGSASLAGAAFASGGTTDPTPPQQCVNTPVQWSSDNGVTWQATSPRTHEAYPMVSVQVRFDPAAEQANPCSATFSLNSYDTEGATWETSGTQVQYDHVSATIDAAHPVRTLTVKTPDCYGQTDLYKGSTPYDGTTGKVPNYPSTMIPGVVAWSNGGTACTTPPPTILPQPSVDIAVVCGKATVTLGFPVTLPEGDYTISPSSIVYTVTQHTETGVLTQDVTVQANEAVAPLVFTYPEDSGTVTIDVSAGGEVLKSATVPTDCQTPPPGVANLTITKTAPKSITLGDASTESNWLITVANTGTAGAPGPLTVTDSLPAGLLYSSFQGSDWTCTSNAAKTVVTCTHAKALAADASSEVTVSTTVAPDLKGIEQICNTAYLGTLASNSACTPTAVAGIVIQQTTPPAVEPAVLPHTGAGTLALALAGAGSLLLGGALVAATLRRREEDLTS